MTEISNKLKAQLLVKACKDFDVKTIVISPGSRNAPLTISFSLDKTFQALQIVDERSAAFFALGIAQQTRKPVVLICTSGSALLNYYPAIAEAFYSRIPLIIFSADRPKHLIDIGDGQTIRQENVFKNHSLCNVSLDDLKTAVEKINTAFQTALLKKGPVHINVPFDEPLYDTTSKIDAVVQTATFKPPVFSEQPLEISMLAPFANLWNAASKKMVLLGEHFPETLLQAQINKLLQDPSVLVMTENTSNVYHQNSINGIDKHLFSLDNNALEDLRPEILITFGGMVVSKKVKQFLRAHKPTHHWHIDLDRAYDTFHCLTKHFKLSAGLFFSQFFFLTTENNTSNYQNKWLLEYTNIKEKHDQYLESCKFSDLKAFEIIQKSLPKHSILQLGNSSIVRYSQLFKIDKSIEVFCNRGTSGIDGSTSTAIGAAFASKKQTTFITGDISFFYDSNALWNHYIKSNFRIVLLNNGGGGIFRFIPGPKESNALPFFEAPHHLDAFHLCNMFGFEYVCVTSKKEIENELKHFYTESERPKLIEIKTPSTQNDLVLKAYFAHLKNIK